MKYTTDNGGTATKCDDIKLFKQGSTWATKLSQLGKSSGKLIIMTHGFQTRYDKCPTESLDDEKNYIKNIFDKRPYDIFIICNSDNYENAKILKTAYPKIRIKHHDKINANIAILEPRTVFISSENFGYSHYDNFGVGFHSQEIYNHYKEIFQDYWKKSKEIE